jgi:membrane protein
MAGIGVVILFWSVMSLLNHIENSFNHIWQISVSRPWYRKFTDYLTIMLIAPVFIILSGSITVFIDTQLAEFISKAPILAFFKPVVSFLIKFSPYFLTWFTITVLFIIMPNTKVKFVPAFVSGIIIGTFLQVLLWLYIDLQFGISKLSAIYGSFAAVPLLILWLQSSWIIVLLGAELSFANQNIAQYDLEAEALSISHYQRRGLSLLIMNLIARNFAVGDRPLSSEEIGRMLKMPVRLVRDILKDLKSINLVTEINGTAHSERFYQPSIDISKITVSYMIGKLDRMGVENKMIIRSKDYERITTLLDKFDKAIAKTGNEILVKDL